MNCKPGDIVIAIGGSCFAGRLFEVLHAAPGHEFHLPDGKLHEGCRPGHWVLRSLGGFLDVPLKFGGARKSMYGTGLDAKLRPIRGTEEFESRRIEETA